MEDGIKNRIVMEKILYTFLLLCGILLHACNESTEIEIPEATLTMDSDCADLTFTPEQLRLPGKKGVCLKLSADVSTINFAKIDELKAFWNYSWGYDFVVGQPNDKEFIPMFWGKKSVNADNLSYLKAQIMNGRCKRILGFNEPDGQKQANMTVEEALKLWPQLQSLKVPLGSPAIVDAAKGEWLELFMAGCKERGYRVDFICVHNYGGTGIEAFKTKMQSIIDKYQLPILITEFAVADWTATSVGNNKHTPEKVLEFMKGILPWLEKNENVLGYSWFQSGIDSPQGWSGAFYGADGKLTKLGEYYRDFTPDPDGGDSGDGDDTTLGSNLILNPGFEDLWTSWTSRNTANTALDQTGGSNQYPISGDRTLRLTGKAAGSFISQVISVEAGKQYELGFTGRIQDAVGASGASVNTGEIPLQMIIRKPGTPNIQYAAIQTISNENSTVSGRFTIDQGVSEIEIYITKSKNIAYVDDVYFKEVISGSN